MFRNLINGLVVCVFVVLVSMVLTATLSSALPIDDDSTDVDSEKRTMLLDKYFDLGNRMRGVRPEIEFDNAPGFLTSPYLSSLLKRGGSPRSSRSGGMSLCLWKVCPAAPWLINK